MSWLSTTPFKITIFFQIIFNGKDLLHVGSNATHHDQKQNTYGNGQDFLT